MRDDLTFLSINYFILIFSRFCRDIKCMVGVSPGFYFQVGFSINLDSCWMLIWKTYTIIFVYKNCTSVPGRNLKKNSVHNQILFIPHINLSENLQIRINSFKETKTFHILLTLWSDKAFKGTVVNRLLPSLHAGSLEITLPVSFSVLF